MIRNIAKEIIINFTDEKYVNKLYYHRDIYLYKIIIEFIIIDILATNRYKKLKL